MSKKEEVEAHLHIAVKIFGGLCKIKYDNFSFQTYRKSRTVSFPRRETSQSYLQRLLKNDLGTFRTFDSSKLMNLNRCIYKKI